MFGFNAFFYKNHVMIENAGAYKTNEVLLAYLDYEFPDLEELIPALAEAVNKGKTLEELGYSALVEKYYKLGLHSEARLMSFRTNQR